ncbi:unnamed protein product [Lactuca saligna]|uniref:HMG box domain-containing protein n=1 Tax=Lactuca saligna TaxID=75948 RepID=A0AA36EJT0_LACSI|nr:unnamed protein product [Lactuca saligna]
MTHSTLIVQIYFSCATGSSQIVLFLARFHFKDHRSSLSFSQDMKGAKGKGATKRGALKPVDDKKVGKKKAVGKGKAKGGKAEKDPNKPKRPPSAFFVFLEEFRVTFKKENPNIKAVSAVGKAGGEKWKSMSASEKAPFEAKAAKRKSEYEKQMNAYNNKQDDDADEESDKSKSEVDEESGQENADVDEEEDDDDDDDDEDDD